VRKMKSLRKNCFLEQQFATKRLGAIVISIRLSAARMNAKALKHYVDCFRLGAKT